MKQDYSKKENRTLKKIRNTGGMTLAEVLTVVAIMVILAGVIFVALSYYQRSMAQVERDGYAKEIFIAAQNHLSMAEGEGYMDVESVIGTSVNGKNYEKSDVMGEVDGDSFFIISNQGDKFHNTTKPYTMLDLMLPFASVDETVRLGGSYIIRYNADEGKIMDVFYCSRGNGKFDFDHPITNEDYAKFKGVTGDNNKSVRRAYPDGDRKPVLGWYGGDEAMNTPTTKLGKPHITVTNGDKLVVDVKDADGNNTAGNEEVLKLVITGKESKAKFAVNLRSQIDTYKRRIGPFNVDELKYILDDITSENKQFSNLALSGDKLGDLIAGEDIEIQVFACCKNKFSNIAYSDKLTENSLYESIADNSAGGDGSSYTALVSSFRHLENLDKEVSNTGYAAGTDNTKKINITAAKQTADLHWIDWTEDGTDKSGFSTNAGNIIVTKTAGSITGYYPVSPESLIAYDGLRHSISDVSVDVNGNAGLFGNLAIGSSVENLELIDFEISGSGSVGALAGNAPTVAAKNVIAHNTEAFDEQKNGDDDYTIESTSGDAGGLIGNITGGTVSYCGAALKVKGAATAGGLVGSADSTMINACYSGGHTMSGEYYKHEKNGNSYKEEREQNGGKDIPLYNVKATGETGYAGGLVGNAAGGTIKNSYSTCSASSKSSENVGGFAGKARSTILRSYSTGLVSGTNAFIGDSTGATIYRKPANACYYYESVNGDTDDGGATVYKEPGPGNVKAMDSSTSTFESFTGGTWNQAVPYDKTLDNYYDGKYCFRTVTQLVSKSSAKIDNSAGGNTSAEGKGAYFVNTHYGDWPSTEVFIINVPED